MKPISTSQKSTKTAVLLVLVIVALTLESAAQNSHRQVIVSIPHHKLAVLQNGSILRKFDIAVGSSVSPSPTGQFVIVNRLSNPTYYHPGVVIPPGPDNPIGTRWIGLNRKGFGIHGTNAPSSVGKSASHGCIRLRNRDVEKLFALLSVGDTVQIRAERDAQTAQIFGSESSNTVLAQATQSMSAAGAQ
ncbi:MAG TPA: L,D-transpeptidase [Terriglobales bacterium]|nr:L,D-transpeptidase [Terriglobales bacterium]